MATSRMSMASRTRNAWSAGHMLRTFPRVAHRLRHAHRLDRLRHVVGSDQMGAGEHGGHRRGQRAGQAPRGIGLTRDLADEGLARGADAYGPAEGAQPPESGEDRAVPRVPRHAPLSEESEAGIDHDALRLDAGSDGDPQALREHVEDGGHGPAEPIGRRLRGHYDEPRAGAGHERGQARIRGEAAHVVDDGRARLEGGAGGLAPRGGGGGGGGAGGGAGGGGRRAGGGGGGGGGGEPAPPPVGKGGGG